MRLRYPLANPIITQRFGENPNDADLGYGPEGHHGVDFRAIEGTAVYAAADGTIERHSMGSEGYGQYIRQTIAGGVLYYAHLGAFLAGGEVKAGDKIALSGNTGNSTAAHLHFELRIDDTPVNPEFYLTDQEDSMLTTALAQRYDKWMNAWAAQIGAQWAKVINPGAGERLFPNVPNLVVRIWTDDIDSTFISNGYQGGRAFVQRMLPEWQARPAAAYELANEPDCNSNDGLANLNAYTLGALDEADAQGIKLVILNLPEGNPHDNGTGDVSVSIWKLRQLLPCVKAAAERGHIIGLHAYWRPGVEGPTGRWHALGRVEWTIQQWISMGAPGSMKVLVNEVGIDGGIAGYPARQGWQSMIAQGLLTREQYTSQIVEAEQFARGVPQIVGLTYFVFGYENPWGTYDHPEAFAQSLVAPLLALGQNQQEFEQALGDFMQAHVIPQNPAAAFYAYGRARDWEPISGEIDYGLYRAQTWYSPETQTQHIVYCLIGDWGNIKHFDRAN